MSEDKIQIELVKYLEENNIKFAMIFQELGVFKRIPGFFQIMNRLIQLGLRKGVPDMLIIVNGQTIFMELKEAKGKLSDHQVKWIDSLRGTGIKVFVCYSLEEAINVILTLSKN